MGKVKLTKPVRNTHVIMVIDASGSMAHIHQQVVDSFNAEIEGLRKASAANPGAGETFVTIWAFDYDGTMIANHVPLADVPEMNYNGYSASGGTALYHTLEAAVHNASPDEAHLLLVITDGDDTQGGYEAWTNAYRRLDRSTWTFVLRGPRGSAAKLSNFFPKDNCLEWSGAAEYVEASGSTVSSFGGYYAQRSTGVTSTKTFFKPDLSKVKGSDLRFMLQEVDGQYRKFAVDRECAINAFVEYKTGKGYVPGSAYYQLTKPEDIEEGRALLLRHRDTGTLYGGQNVRNVVSMPSVGIVKAKPGNMGEYDLFVESHSLNRRLVRGTDIYVKK